MLQEIRNPRQNTNERRRIFSDSFFDLYVWLNDDDSIAGFQLCYDKGNFERALTWTEEYGFSHEKIDDGEGRTNFMKMKPILVADGLFDNTVITERFRKACRSIDRQIGDFVIGKLETFR